MFNVCQHRGHEAKVEDKERLFETSGSAEILQDCQRRSPAYQGHSHSRNKKFHELIIL